jgi:peroxiredoxin Q/BCP
MPFVDVSDAAPDFELHDQDGQPTRLEDLCAKGPVVLFFYPKDETTVCTLEACGFRDSFAEFEKCSAQIVGISQDSVASHAAFRQNHRLPYLLLSDPGGRVAKSFGVKKTLGLFPGRATFVVDRNRRVLLRFSSAVNAAEHVSRALQEVRRLQRGSSSSRPT